MQKIKAVVIGSGYGGAVAALRLGQAGIETVVLERGRRWSIDDPTANATFATFNKPDGRAEWLNTVTKTPAYEGIPIEKFAGVLELRKIGEYTFMAGSGVGGGSLVYGGILIQPAEKLFRQVFPETVDYGEMDRVYFPRVRSIIRMAPIPDDILNSEYYLGLKVLWEQAQKAGFPEQPSAEHATGDCSVRFPMAVDWDIVRQEIAGDKAPSVIGAEFWFGNNSGAKQSLERDYLKLAEETGHVRIRPLHLVTDIAEEAGGGYRVRCDILMETGAVVDTQTLVCDYLFVAAGTLGTNEMLLRAKAKGQLPRLNEHLGEGVGNDGDTFVYRTNLSEITNPHLGGPGAIAIVNYDNPVAPCLMMRAPLPRFLQDFPEKNAIGTFVFSMTPHRGRFTYDAATESVELDFAPDPLSQAAAQHLAAKLSEASGGDVSPVSFSVTGHQLGGACMGKVCDDCGRVLGHPHLYVVDGALIPGSSTPTNPAFTIAAIAERCLEHIVEEDINA